jgi:hypothetical protein
MRRRSWPEHGPSSLDHSSHDWLGSRIQVSARKQMTMTNRLDRIATRQRTSRIHTIVFASFLALAGIISVSAVNTAVAAATSSDVVQR